MHSIHKNEAKKLNFGLEVPLHGFKKHLEQIFEFLIFLEIWRIVSKISDVLSIFSKILDIKNLFQVFLEPM